MTIFLDREIEIAVGIGRVWTNPSRNSLTGDKWGDWCQCSGCVNWRIARQLFLPPEILERLHEFGLELGQFAGHSYVPGRTPPGLYRASRHYFLPEARVEGARTLRQNIGRWHWLDVGPLDKIDGSSWYQFPHDSLVLRLSTVLPSFATALSEFEQDNSTQCPHCGSTWMSSGRIRSPHRIAKWFKVKESEAKKGRIFRICWECLKPSFFRATSDYLVTLRKPMDFDGA